MGLADALGAWIDSRKRYAGRLLRDVTEAPADFIAQWNGQASDHLNEQRALLDDSRSVMPQVRDAAQQQSAQQAVDMALNFNGAGAIKAFHGSPHTFDKFDLSKIGTGEGAQVYGHGLYFAESPGTAAFYRDMEHPSLGADPRDEVTALRQNWQANTNPRPLNEDEVRYLMRDFGTLNSLRTNKDVVKNITRVVNGSEPGGTVSSEAIYAMRALDKQLPAKPSGQLYEVNLRRPNADREAIDPLGPQHFLDWDKPLRDQPVQVQMAVDDAGARTGHAWLRGAFHGGMTGQQVYRTFAAHLNPANTRPAFDAATNVPAASDALRRSGLPGLRYLDAGSRTAGGTSNYVLFDDALAEILRRNGMPP